MRIGFGDTKKNTEIHLVRGLYLHRHPIRPNLPSYHDARLLNYLLSYLRTYLLTYSTEQSPS